jgi:hypothetical protein
MNKEHKKKEREWKQAEERTSSVSKGVGNMMRGRRKQYIH